MLRYCLVISLFLISLTTIPQTVQAQKTALEFNDQLATITDSLNFYGREWGGEAKEALQSKDFKPLVASRQRLETYINRQLSGLATMKDVKNSGKLREAMISFLNFEKSAIISAMKPFEKMTAGTADEEQQKAIEALTESSKGEEAELHKVYVEQQAYAKANGFPLEEKIEETE